MKLEFTGRALALTQTGLQAAAESIAVPPDALRAVVSVETCGKGFLADSRPQILYERHIFHRFTAGRFDDPAGEISSPLPGGYGPPGAHQYDRLQKAIACDRTAALQSASWGLGQIMGENFAAAGFADVESMVAAMVDSEDAQLSALCCFLKHTNLDEALRRQDWLTFARKYNGPAFAEHAYDSRLAQAFLKFSREGVPLAA